ncbi:MAG TPA: hypothetical protein PKD37_04740 [Oligoflexia bacterium]|nr:hypothetical protein [Oligoflexia bacterium]HMP27272.1 hypothetical protein [Oligoflexia bacterium]
MPSANKTIAATSRKDQEQPQQNSSPDLASLRPLSFHNLASIYQAGGKPALAARLAEDHTAAIEEKKLRRPVIPYVYQLKDGKFYANGQKASSLFDSSQEGFRLLKPFLKLEQGLSADRQSAGMMLSPDYYNSGRHYLYFYMPDKSKPATYQCFALEFVGSRSEFLSFARKLAPEYLAPTFSPSSPLVSPDIKLPSKDDLLLAALSAYGWSARDRGKQDYLRRLADLPNFEASLIDGAIERAKLAESIKILLESLEDQKDVLKFIQKVVELIRYDGHSLNGDILSGEEYFAVLRKIALQIKGATLPQDVMNNGTNNRSELVGNLLEVPTIATDFLENNQPPITHQKKYIWDNLNQARAMPVSFLGDDQAFQNKAASLSLAEVKLLQTIIRLRTKKIADFQSGMSDAGDLIDAKPSSFNKPTVGGDNFIFSLIFDRNNAKNDVWRDFAKPTLRPSVAESKVTVLAAAIEDSANRKPFLANSSQLALLDKGFEDLTPQTIAPSLDPALNLQFPKSTENYERFFSPASPDKQFDLIFDSKQRQQLFTVTESLLVEEKFIKRKFQEKKIPKKGENSQVALANNSFEISTIAEQEILIDAFSSLQTKLKDFLLNDSASKTLSFDKREKYNGAQAILEKQELVEDKNTLREKTTTATLDPVAFEKADLADLILKELFNEQADQLISGAEKADLKTPITTDLSFSNKDPNDKFSKLDKLKEILVDIQPEFERSRKFSAFHLDDESLQRLSLELADGYFNRTAAMANERSSDNRSLFTSQTVSQILKVFESVGFREGNKLSKLDQFNRKKLSRRLIALLKKRREFQKIREFILSMPPAVKKSSFYFDLLIMEIAFAAIGDRGRAWSMLLESGFSADEILKLLELSRKLRKQQLYYANKLHNKEALNSSSNRQFDLAQ